MMNEKQSMSTPRSDDPGGDPWVDADEQQPNKLHPLRVLPRCLPEGLVIGGVIALGPCSAQDTLIAKHAPVLCMQIWRAVQQFCDSCNFPSVLRKVRYGTSSGCFACLFHTCPLHWLLTKV